MDRHDAKRPVCRSQGVTMKTDKKRSAAIATIAALDDQVRARLYATVRAAGGPVTREQAAAEVGISRKLAAFHLEKLVDAGLLDSGPDIRIPRRVGRAPK